MDRANLGGHTILVVEEQPLIALDLRTALEQAGAKVVVTREASDAITHISRSDISGAVIDWRPASDGHRVVARALKQRSVRFVFYATQPPEDVTTVRGAAVILKPARPEVIVKTLALLMHLSRNGAR